MGRKNKTKFHKHEKALNEQEGFNIKLKDEMMQLKEALFSAEKQKKETMEDISIVALKMLESERSQSEKDKILSETNQKLEAEVDAIRTLIMNQKAEIDKLSANISVSDQALEDMTKLINQREKDHKEVLQSEKAKLEILSQKLEEKTTESSERVRRLNEKDEKLEELKAESGKTSQEIQHLENELAKIASQRKNKDAELESFKMLVSEKDTKIDKLNEEKSDLESKQELLKKEIDLISEKLEDVMSIKKDADEVEYQKLVQQNNDLLEEARKNANLMEENEKLMNEERAKLNEQINSANILIKKSQKKRENLIRKWRRMLDASNAEKEDLLEQNKSLLEKLDSSPVSSTSDDSLNSLNFEEYEALEDSIRVLKTTINNTEENLSQISKQLVDKEQENLDLHRTVVAYKSKIDDHEQIMIKNQKTITIMESRFIELQRSSDGLQKRYDDDLLMMRQKLESSENALEIQQELNAQTILHSEELRQHHDAEKLALEEEIIQLKNSANNQELEKVERAAVLTLAENEKTKLCEEIKLLESQLGNVQKALNEQEGFNIKLKDEMMQLEKALVSAEKQKNETMEEISNIAQKMLESDRSQSAKEKILSDISQKLEAEVDALRTQIMKQDVEIEKLSASISLSDQALEDMTKLVNQREKDHEKVLQSEKAKFEILSKKLEEKTTESSERVRRLKEKDEKIEEMRVESEKATQGMREKISQMENELAKVVSQRKKMDAELDSFKMLVSEKETNIGKLNEEKSDLELKQELLEKEIDIINKKLEDVMSPKKDKVLQLENRLEVMQTAAKAQHKRLEDELSTTRAALELTAETNQELEKQMSDLRKKSQLVDELASANKMIGEELEKANDLKDVIAGLEKQQEEIQTENAEERAGLVNELIDAKQKLVEYEQLIHSSDDQQKSTDSDSDKVEELSQPIPENIRAIDEMFPSMDPAVRQLVILLSENRNYSYGALGLVIYGFLIHLYILFY